MRSPSRILLIALLAAVIGLIAAHVAVTAVLSDTADAYAKAHADRDCARNYSADCPGDVFAGARYGHNHAYTFGV